MLGLRRDQGWPEDLQERFGSLGIYVSKRGNSMRVSPYLYNDQGDVERLFEAIDQLESS
jgi:selenocysteine lyase/cysteine desulfurase